MGNILSVPDKTIFGWIVISIAGGGYVYKSYHAKKARGQKLASQKQRAHELRDNQPKKENKAKRQRMESFASESRLTQPKKHTTTAQSKIKDYSSDDGIDNYEFAKQMAQAKNKSTPTPKAINKQQEKSVRQSNGQEMSPGGPGGPAELVIRASSSSSMAGIDADDDQSSVASPNLSAADPAGVSDMLEQSVSGPSVLRLTDTADKQQKSTPSNPPQHSETKKQRQNRQKAAMLKAQREEYEKARKVLMEAQRRTAREAEGRAAKDGSAFMAAQKPSPWTGPGTGVNGNSEQKAALTIHQPLDTFDSTLKIGAVAAPTQVNRKASGKGPSWAEIPFSEEEQLEMIKKQAEEAEWVPVGSKSRKKNKNANVVSETDDSAAENGPSPPTTRPAPKAKPANGRPQTQALPTQSSFAALSDDGANLGDEQQEQEWDV